MFFGYLVEYVAQNLMNETFLRQLVKSDLSLKMRLRFEFTSCPINPQNKIHVCYNN